MWAALRSDLREFVSTVADDASSALTKIDAKLDEGDDDDDDNNSNNNNNNSNTNDEGDETEELLQQDSQSNEPTPTTTARSTTPPPPLSSQSNNNNKKKTSNSQVYVDTDGNVSVISNDTFASTGIVSSPADEVARLSTRPETFLEPLQVETDEEFVELKDFLSNFSVEAKTEEISQLLENNADLQHQFETLVPTQVKYEDFWQRYFFRCSEERIATKWQQRKQMKDEEDEQEEEEQAQQAASKAAFAGGLLSVRSLFGGALSAMSQTLEAIDDDNENEGDEPVATSPFHTTASSSKTSTFPGLNLFGSSGRPPFVMNTAIDESFDDNNNNPPEEEELGWDDEEEDDGQTGGGRGSQDEDDDDDADEEIEFKDDAKELLQKQLAQAISERDQLHHTVELQRNEIATLKQSQAASTDVQTLQMELFEKNSELAALKASLEDAHDDDDDNNNNNNLGSKKDAARVALQERELERLSNELSEKECELLDLKQQLRKIKTELQEEKATATLSPFDKTAALALEEARVLNIELQSKLAALEHESVKKEDEPSSPPPSQQELEATRAELQAAQALIQQSNSRIEELFAQLETSKQHAAALELQLTAVTGTAATAVAATVTTTSAAKQDRSDQALSPVKVPPPAATAVAPAVAPLPQEPQPDEIQHHSMSPDSSTSTGVKVRVAADDSVRPAATAGGKEEDDWGDDWGDDDDVDV